LAFVFPFFASVQVHLGNFKRHHSTSSLRAKPDTTIGAASDRNGLDLDFDLATICEQDTI
jgi:hypothetical protein